MIPFASRILPALASLALTAVAATAQTTVTNKGVFWGSGNPTSVVQGITNQLGVFQGTGAVVGQTPTGSLLGTFHWQGAGGNSLSGTFQLTLTTMLAPGVFVFVQQAQTTGGTGTFVNASGTDQAVGIINLNTSQFTGAFRGQLTY
jgi:outer membrane biogenesis lipoprotein LolB